MRNATAAALLLFVTLLGFHPAVARAADDDRHVVVISIDGFPAYLLPDPAAPIPTLRKLANEGVVEGRKVFDLSKPSSPCYACVFPEGGEGEELRCAVTGVLAPLTGVIGALQAMEAIKLIAGAGHALDGLLIFDAKTTGWRAVRASKDPSCPACSVQ